MCCVMSGPEYEPLRARHHPRNAAAIAVATATPSKKSTAGSKNGIAWVRPTDLATYAAPLVGRGIDLQAELIRRARRTSTWRANRSPRTD